MGTIKRPNHIKDRKYQMIPAYLRVDKTLLVLELTIRQFGRIDIEVARKAGTDTVNAPCRAVLFGKLL
jgi:hypothetical protein